jgi:hypothetical protein
MGNVHRDVWQKEQRMNWGLLIIGVCGLLAGPFTIIFHKRIGSYIFNSEQYGAAKYGASSQRNKWTRFSSEDTAQSTFLYGGITGCIIGIGCILLALTT